MNLFFDFKCENNHVSERFIDDSIETTSCKECGLPAIKMLSTPRIHLEGITGAFPGAADKWVKDRAEKLKYEQKRNSQDL